MKMEGIDWFGVVLMFLLLIFVGMCIGVAIYEPKIVLSQETANKICLDLTNEEGVVAKDWQDFESGEEPIEKGELYCQIPSYDKTHLIKVGT